MILKFFNTFLGTPTLTRDEKESLKKTLSFSIFMKEFKPPNRTSNNKEVTAMIYIDSPTKFSNSM
jgi:hypothetical protein